MGRGIDTLLGLIPHNMIVKARKDYRFYEGQQSITLVSKNSTIYIDNIFGCNPLNFEKFNECILFEINNEEYTQTLSSFYGKNVLITDYNKFMIKVNDAIITAWGLLNEQKNMMEVTIKINSNNEDVIQAVKDFAKERVEYVTFFGYNYELITDIKTDSIIMRRKEKVSPTSEGKVDIIFSDETKLFKYLPDEVVEVMEHLFIKKS